MPRLVQRELITAWHPERGKNTPSLVAGRTSRLYSSGGQLAQRALDVITYQVELMLRIPIGWVHRHLCGGQCEDQPPIAGIDPGPAEDVTEKRSICHRVAAVQDDVCTLDHGVLPSVLGQLPLSRMVFV